MADERDEESAAGTGRPRARRGKAQTARSTRPRRARAAEADGAAATVAEAVQETGRAAAGTVGAIRREMASHPVGLIVAGMLASFVLGYFVGAHRRELAGLPPR
jgi:hypothetical protein